MPLTHVRQIFIAPPYQDSAEAGRLVLRDGSTATIRLAQPADRLVLEQFFQRLSPESRHRRFVSATLPGSADIAGLCEATDYRRQLTLVVTRLIDGIPQIIASGSYFAKGEQAAEVALAVEDTFQGQGCRVVDARIRVEPSGEQPTRHVSGLAAQDAVAGESESS